MLTVIVVMTCTTIRAQNIFSSPYSVYGIGMLNNRSSSLSRSIGGTGIAVQDENNINPINPASYGSIKTPITHIHEIGSYLESNRYISNSVEESKTTGGITNLNYWFKFAPWWSASAGLTPFSTVSYNIKTVRELGTSSLVNYTYQGSGNINQLYLGNSFQVMKNLSLGVHASYLFGSIVKSESIDLSSESSYLTYENKIVARKFHFDFGLQYKIAIKDKSLIIGAIADNGLQLTGKQENALYDVNSDTLSSAVGKSVHYKLPRYVGAGLSFQAKRYIIAADLKFENWSQAQYAGFNVQQYPVLLKGTSMPVWGVAAGVSLPMFDGKSALNLTYSMDQMGTEENKLILQRSQKIMLDIVFRDLWGNRRRSD
jgi:hypothetical protein